MTNGFLGVFLQELGALLHLPDLHPDANHSCLIKFKKDLQVQIEMTHSGQQLLVGIDLGLVPVGRYRENVFEAALISNGLPPPRYGTFAYSKQTDHLVLFHFFPIKGLHAQQVVDFLSPLAEKAHLWKEAISKNTVPTVKTKNKGGARMFGLSH